ncbi:hypothetical protein ACHMW7_16180 [Aminobacter sp. UC22_36]|uniref:hypothetical protein n=1 Tax=Aminobacter sp. UC22_36 TaxID=3374549 RepID=UPI003756EBBC
MTEANQAAPSAAETAALSADDLNLLDPRLADGAKSEDEIWNEVQAEKAAKDDGGDTPEPVPAAAVVEPQAGAPAAEPAPSKPADAGNADIWATATPEQKAAFEAASADKAKFEQRYRSSVGRISALQKKINAAQATPSRDIGNARDEIAGIQQDYPDIGQPLIKALEKIDGKLDHLSNTEKADLESARTELNEIVDGETKRLLSVHPDYEDVLAKNGKAFVAWVEDQPRSIREAAHQNAQFIADSDGAAKVIEGFKRHLGLIKEPPAPAPTPQPAPQPKLDDRRQRQIEGSASPQRTGGRPTITGIPAEGDEDAIWAAIQAEKAQKARA